MSMSDSFHDKRDSYLRTRLGRFDGPCLRAMGALISEARVKVKDRADIGQERGGEGFSEAVLMRPTSRMLAIGVQMEQTVSLVKAINEEAKESKEILQELDNQIRAISDLVQPRLLEQAQQLRAARMTVVSEVQLSLTALRDVRKFFLESDYDKEVARLERLVTLCRQLKELKDEGVLDAVLDSALRLAVKE